jgi:hypothetical protein
MLRPALASTVLLIAAIGALSPHTNATPSSALLGTWRLTAVAGKGPGTINVKSWQVEFLGQAKWLYSGEMAGDYEGTKLSGSGTWSVQGNQLDYTAGANKGQTTVHLDRDSLMLSPDPVLRLHGKDPVDTQYLRSVSP